jgi:AbiTii
VLDTAAFGPPLPTCAVHRSRQLFEVLRKTKLLLHQIGKKELTGWVNHELNGYPSDAELPNYRILKCTVMGNLISPGWKADRQALPIQHLDATYREQLERAEMRESLAVVQELSTNKKGSLRRLFPPEANLTLGSNLANRWQVQNAWCEISTLSVLNILIQVRSRLLDFMLELKDTVGQATTEFELKQKATSVDATSMFNYAIFGPNATIVVGDHNRQNIRKDRIKGDFETLARVLTTSGIPSDEIERLKTAVSRDESNGQTTPFEGKTGAWLVNLLGRAAKGGLKVGVDVASKVATDALVAYFQHTPS